MFSSTKTTLKPRRMPDLKRIIGGRVRRARQARESSSRAGRRAKKMTIGDLAEAAGLSVDYVNKLELGQHMPTADTLVRIAAALDIGVDQLLPESPASRSERDTALAQLVEFAQQYDTEQIQYLIDVLRTVMKRGR